jgi:hypothetical protein
MNLLENEIKTQGKLFSPKDRNFEFFKISPCVIIQCLLLNRIQYYQNF